MILLLIVSFEICCITSGIIYSLHKLCSINRRLKKHEENIRDFKRIAEVFKKL